MDDMKMRKMRKPSVKPIRPPRPTGMDEDGGMAPRPMRMPMTPRPEVEEAAMADVRREQEREAMGRAYDEAPRRSMALGLQSGGSVADSEAEETLEYRKRPDYSGYEDYTPSGRAALKEYNKASQNAQDMTKREGGPPYSPSAAKKAQAKQREVAAEIKRETRGTVTEGKYAKGGSVSSASKRADGCAQRGKTKGRMV